MQAIVCTLRKFKVAVKEQKSSMKLDIKAILAEYPAPYLYYDGRLSWTLYKSKDSYMADNGELPAEARRELIIEEGDDYDTVGYLPVLVDALCKAVGIGTGSI